MEQHDISKENRAVMLKMIVTANRELLSELKGEFQDKSAMQVYTVFLFKLGYTPNEIRILLGVSIRSITEMSDLIKDLK